MMTTTYSIAVTHVVATATLVLIASAFILAPAMASAATYGYVDTAGEVKTVTAPDWMTAIATAPLISIHSGVMLLATAADYMVVGNTVGGVK